MGLTVIAAAVSAGATFSTAAAALYGSFGFAALQLGAQLLVTTALSRIFNGGGQQQDNLKRELSFPTSLPNKRFWYGETMAVGTPMPSPVVGDFFYVAWLVNSRPSEGPFEIFLDGRPVGGSGDPFDFSSGGGATATRSPYIGFCEYWIQTGEQTRPPRTFLEEARYVSGGDELLWRPKDAGMGNTIVFAKLQAGPDETRADRWPNALPKLEVKGKFSKVYDMRDPSQTKNNPNTWKWSENTFLCALDMMRQNPFRPYQLDNIDLESWEAAADAADESVARRGGSEKRYSISGVVTFDGSEVHSLLSPMLATGAAQSSRAGGRLGVVPGVERTVATTITDSLGDIQFSAMEDYDQLVTELRVNYSPSKRNYEAGELPPYEIPDVLDSYNGLPKVETLDLSLVSSDSQVQRIRSIVANKSTRQKALSFVAPPSAIKAVAGSVVQVDFPAPYTVMNGLYEVQSINPFIADENDDGVAMRSQVSLKEYSHSIFAWSSTSEQIISHPA